jgi:hypothetical protein
MILDAVVVLLSHAERDGAPDLIHGSRHIDVGRPERCLHGAIAAADVVADTRGHHDLIGRHHAANRHRIALVMIGAQHAAAGLARRVEATLELLERGRLNLAKGDELVLRHPV